MHENEQYLYEVLKPAPPDTSSRSLADRDLIDACRAVMRGEPFLYPAELTAVIRDHLSNALEGDGLRNRGLVRDAFDWLVEHRARVLAGIAALSILVGGAL